MNALVFDLFNLFRRDGVLNVLVVDAHKDAGGHTKYAEDRQPPDMLDQREAKQRTDHPNNER